MMRALVIDDSRAMRSILRNILSELDFDVVEAADGKQAVRTLADDPRFDLALVDWNLPEMNGLEIVTEVRSTLGMTDIKLLMVTTETEFDRVAQALDAGADEYIMKPFDRDMLLDKLLILGVPVHAVGT
jgi:two-component system chemotaxis response regulator CheY